MVCAWLRMAGAMHLPCALSRWRKCVVDVSGCVRTVCLWDSMRGLTVQTLLCI